ncbi:sulfite exporter TauE/SafE family protein 3 isoform X1 [Hevea brasiliensis]|uniref:sulfite exporter TauE/SafE family protein 3 isoform X1 n=1 Tax=Hevea brasiliensis TaxID=3981 RepID=UPI0025E06685|nr:sulfite exporter TauE/SafE family protein 3 isoform X1 [Hevea brasiliensis]
MAVFGANRSVFKCTLIILFSFLLAPSVLVSAKRNIQHEQVTRLSREEAAAAESNFLVKASNFLWQADQSRYQHVWPDMKFEWQVVIGTIIGFFGAAFGSVGGVGGGGIFVPMLTMIIGFDPKSATAISKCMIMGAAASSVYYNLKLRHPTLDLPIVDYDLVLLIQPVLLLGISIGVTLNVIFPDWVVTVLLIILLLGTSVKAYFKGVDTWKKETTLKEKAAESLVPTGGNEQVEYSQLPGGPSKSPHKKDTKEREVTVVQNMYWKEFGLLVFVWMAFLALQIAKNYTATCSTTYWLLNLSQVPVSIGVFLYEAVGLYTGRKRIASKGDEGINWKAHKLLGFFACGLLAGIVGGLLGLGGGFVMGPLFLELGIPPQVTSATATFGMTFSSSMSVVEYYLLNRFPIPYALYFIVVATIAAFMGQQIINKLIAMTGRASLIICVLAFTIFVSALSLGGVGISNMIGKIERGESMGFENLCNYEA